MCSSDLETAVTHYELNRLAILILNSLSETTSGGFSGLSQVLNATMNANEVPFCERRYLSMVISDIAQGKACATDGESAKVLWKISAIALNLHAQWAGVSFWSRRAPIEAATRREIETRRAEQREYDAKRDMLGDVVDRLAVVTINAIAAINERGGFRPAHIDARTNVTIEAPKPIEVKAEPEPEPKAEPEPKTEPKTGKAKRVEAHAP